MLYRQHLYLSPWEGVWRFLVGIIWFLGEDGGGGFNRCEKSLEGGLKRIHRQSGGGGRGEAYHCDTAELYGRSWIHSRESRI